MSWALVIRGPLSMHGVPVDDLRDHLYEDCPCKPVEHEPGFWVHNSFDGREAFEEGKRKPS